MTAPRFKFSLAATIVVCLAALTATAHADVKQDIEYVAGVIDTIDKVVPKGAPDGLPFDGNDLRNASGLIEKCQSASNADAVIACADEWSKSEAGQQAGIPDWFPQALDIYFDIEAPDYWGLLEDGGEAVACATGTILTGGVDVCGAIKELINAAKDVLKAAEAVAQFIGDIGAALGSVADSVYCWFSDCDDGPAQPTAAEKAWQYFYLPRIPHGLDLRLASKIDWMNYSGEGSNSDGIVINEGLAAAGGFTLAGLQQAKPQFIGAVNAQWDSKMLAASQAVQKIAFNWNASWAHQYFDNIMASVGAYQTDAQFGMWKLGIAEGKKKAHNDCVTALDAAGGAKVDAWVSEGGPKRLPNGGSGFKWPDVYSSLCNGFDSQLASLFVPAMLQRLVPYVDHYCPGDGGGNHVCLSTYAVQDCKTLMTLQGKPTQLCQWVGPGKGVFKCGNVYKLLSLPEPPGGYKGCTRAQINNGPVPPTGPDKGL